MLQKFVLQTGSVNTPLPGVPGLFSGMATGDSGSLETPSNVICLTQVSDISSEFICMGNMWNVMSSEV
jgi:hypothetical protein